MGQWNFGVIVFPGSNCDHDTYWVLKHVLHQRVEFVWHEEESLEGFDVVILPGGFSYGDYLRTGIMAVFSPVIQDALPSFIEKGGIVLGICNGFQILLEARLLPGAMLPNKGLEFICDDVWLRVERHDTPFTYSIPHGKVLQMPIAHYEGNFFASPSLLEKIRKNRNILFKYCSPDGKILPSANPNGSRLSIAGLCSENGLICGLMPHPERASEAFLGSADGLFLFQSIVDYLDDRKGSLSSSQNKSAATA